MNSIPLFLERLVFVGFTDWGLAWTDPIEISDLAGSVGGSVIFDFKLGYGDRIDLFFQYAHGFEAEVGVDYLRAAVLRSF